MGMGDAVVSYVDAIGILQELSRAVSLPEVCRGMLGKRVSIPVQLPMISGVSCGAIRRRSREVANAVREYARGIGVGEVAVPYLDGCVPIFRSVCVDSLDIDVQEKSYPGLYSLVAVVVDPKNEPVRRIPLAWHGMPRSADYVDYLSVVYLTALFISRNPWFADAVKAAVARVLSEYRKMLDEAANFYNALRLLGAEMPR